MIDNDLLRRFPKPGLFLSIETGKPQAAPYRGNATPFASTENRAKSLGALRGLFILSSAGSQPVEYGKDQAAGQFCTQNVEEPRVKTRE